MNKTFLVVVMAVFGLTGCAPMIWNQRLPMETDTRCDSSDTCTVRDTTIQNSRDNLTYTCNKINGQLEFTQKTGVYDGDLLIDDKIYRSYEVNDVLLKKAIYSNDLWSYSGTGEGGTKRRILVDSQSLRNVESNCSVDQDYVDRVEEERQQRMEGYAEAIKQENADREFRDNAFSVASDTFGAEVIGEELGLHDDVLAHPEMLTRSPFVFEGVNDFGYQVQQQISGDLYLVMSDYAPARNNSLPILLSYDGQLIEKSYIENFIGVYLGIERYSTAFGMKQAAVIRVEEYNPPVDPDRW